MWNTLKTLNFKIKLALVWVVSLFEALDIKFIISLLYNFRINPRLSPLFYIPKLSCCKLQSSTRQSRAGGVDWRLQGTQLATAPLEHPIIQPNRTERRQSQKAASKEIDSGIDHKWTEAMVRGGWAGAQEAEDAQEAGQVVAGIACTIELSEWNRQASAKGNRNSQSLGRWGKRQVVIYTRLATGVVLPQETGGQRGWWRLWWHSIRSSIHTAGSLSRRWRWSLPRSCPAIT